MAVADEERKKRGAKEGVKKKTERWTRKREERNKRRLLESAGVCGVCWIWFFVCRVSPPNPRSLSLIESQTKEQASLSHSITPLLLFGLSPAQ